MCHVIHERSLESIYCFSVFKSENECSVSRRDMWRDVLQSIKTLFVPPTPNPHACPAFVCGHIKQVRINVVRQQCLWTYYRFSTTQSKKPKKNHKEGTR